MVKHALQARWWTARLWLAQIGLARIGLALTWLSLLLAANAWAEVSVSLDRNPVRVNETFVLNVKTDEVDADEPRLDLPGGVQLIRRNTISSRSIVNGKISAERTWRYSLVARQPGEFTIPPLTVGAERSSAITISVLAADSKATAATGTQPVLLRASVDQQTVYSQQQVLMTVQLLRNVPLRFAQLTEPNLPTALVQKLGDDSEYETIVNGVSYMVIERRYAIFPQQPGELVIDPIRFQADVSSERQLSLFGAINETQPISLESPAIRLNVLAPAQSSDWLPAQQIDIADAISNGPYRVGEPLTWTITLIADGVLPAQLPSLSPELGQRWKLYPDQPQDKVEVIATGVRSTRTQKFALVPLGAGELTLPRVDLHWWRLSDNSAQTASVAPLTLTVEPALNTATPAIAIPTTPALSAPTVTPPTDTSTVERDPIAHADQTSLWPWLTALFAILWLATLGLWWWRQRVVQDTASQTHALAAREQAEKTEASTKALLDACKRNDAPAARNHVLLLTEADSLGSLAAQHEASLAAAINDLQQALYGPPPQRWQGERLAAVVPQLLRKTPRARKSATTPALAPLYPAH